MSEMKERVANVFSEALERLQSEGHIEIRATADFSSREIARAAIEAMREPTEQMRIAGIDKRLPVQNDNSEDPKAPWKRMIDEALK